MKELSAIEERLEVLESRLAFQDHELSELNKVVTKQQDQIDLLTRHTRELTEQVKALAVTKGPERPPHY